MAASWKEILDVNLMGYVFCAKAAVPLMRNTGGAIVNVASVRSVVAGGGNLQYDTTNSRAPVTAASARVKPATAALGRCGADGTA